MGNARHFIGACVSYSLVGGWLALAQPAVGGDGSIEEAIREARTGLLTIEAPAGTQVRVEQVRHEFWFGAALANSVFSGWLAEEQAARYKEIFLQNFNAAVTENALKWHDMEPAGIY